MLHIWGLQSTVTETIKWGSRVCETPGWGASFLYCETLTRCPEDLTPILEVEKDVHILFRGNLACFDYYIENFNQSIPLFYTSLPRGSWAPNSENLGAHILRELISSPYGCNDKLGNVWAICLVSFWKQGRGPKKTEFPEKRRETLFILLIMQKQIMQKKENTYNFFLLYACHKIQLFFLKNLLCW